MRQSVSRVRTHGALQGRTRVLSFPPQTTSHCSPDDEAAPRGPESARELSQDSKNAMIPPPLKHRDSPPQPPIADGPVTHD
jgi:hypothetical protein